MRKPFEIGGVIVLALGGALRRREAPEVASSKIIKPRPAVTTG